MTTRIQAALLRGLVTFGLAVGLCATAQAQTITTVAGTGTPGSSGDGGPATSARLNYAFGVAVDAAGNRYIADLGNYRIRKVTPGGVISTVAGTGTGGFSGDGGPASSARISEVYRVALDAAGNLYLPDFGNHRIRKVTPGGIISTGTPGFSGDGGPATSAQLNSLPAWPSVLATCISPTPTTTGSARSRGSVAARPRATPAPS